jgi:hypothetical protein
VLIVVIVVELADMVLGVELGAEFGKRSRYPFGIVLPMKSRNSSS